MKQQQFFILLFFFILGMYSCSKNKMVPTIDTPVFFFNGTIGNEVIQYKAGENNMYMHTDYYKDVQNLFTLQGYFANTTVTNTNTDSNYLMFEIKDGDPTTTNNLQAQIQTLLSTGTFKSYSLDSILTALPDTFNFYAQTNNPIGTTYAWDFGDGTSSTAINPVHTFTSQGVKNVRLITTFGSQKDTITNAIDATNNSTCRLMYNLSVDTTNSKAIVSAITGATNCLWDFGDSTTAFGNDTSRMYTSAGIYKIKLTGTIGSCTTNFSQKARVTASLNNSMASYTYGSFAASSSNYAPRINSYAFIITYKKGTAIYHSYKNNKQINQSNNVVFTLTSFGPWEMNTNNQSTARLTGTVNTWLYNENNVSDSIKIVSDKVQIAVAYPN